VSHLVLENMQILPIFLVLWLRSFFHKHKNQVLINVVAFCWALWLNRNEVVFQRSKSKSILQDMFRGNILDLELVHHI
jgi:hypothetical protein